jgi:mRNA interferase RelE/StbE
VLKLSISEKVVKSLASFDRKHANQIAYRILELLANPSAPDISPLKGSLRGYLRADAGEYRIVFFIDDGVLQIVGIGKRNDDAVYKALERKHLR